MIDVRVTADLEAARTDPRAFADVAGVPLTEAQAAAIRDPVIGVGPQFAAILAPRQTGKSRTLAVAAAWAAARKGGTRVLIASASEEASKRLMREVRGVLASPAFRGSLEEETTTLARLSNGSEVRCVAASERAVRGWTADLLIIDEGALIGDDLMLGGALPTVAATSGRVIVASSAGAAFGFFYDTVMRGRAGSEHVALHEWTVEDAAWMSPSTVAALEASMSQLRADAEFRNVFAGQGALLFGSGKVVRDAVADVHPPRLAGLAAGPARGWFGFDPAGRGGDHAALCGLVRVPQAGPRVFMVAEAFAWPASAPIVGPGSVTEDLVSCGAPMGRLTCENNNQDYLFRDLGRRLAERPPEVGGGTVSVRDPQRWNVVDRADQMFGTIRAPRPADPERRRAFGFTTQYAMAVTDAPMKVACFSALRIMLERRALVIPAGFEALIRELLLLSVDLTATGVERIQASTGHDDLAMSLALGLAPHRSSSGRWRVLLAERADPQAQVPAPWATPATDGDVVTTPSGVTVPRRPVLQSIDGPELTVPEIGTGPTDADAVLRARVAAAVAAKDQTNQETEDEDA